jgi:hypothetical protein
MSDFPQRGGRDREPQRRGDMARVSRLEAGTGPPGANSTEEPPRTIPCPRRALVPFAVANEPPGDRRRT